MKDSEAFILIGQRCEELTKKPDVQAKMVDIMHTTNKAAAIEWLYKLAIATLVGVENITKEDA